MGKWSSTSLGNLETVDLETAFGKQELLYQLVYFHILSETISDHLTTIITYICLTTPQSIMDELCIFEKHDFSLPAHQCNLMPKEPDSDSWAKTPILEHESVSTVECSSSDKTDVATTKSPSSQVDQCKLLTMKYFEAID